MSVSTYRPAEVFPVGDFLVEELEARGWNQKDLAAILDRSPALVSEVLSGKRGLTIKTAQGLADAFGTSTELWLRLDSSYQASIAQPNEEVSKRARLFEKAPVREMVSREWIRGTDDVGELEKRVLRFFEIEALDEAPSLTRYAARKSSEYGATTPAQIAWLFRCRQMARTMDAPTFTRTRLKGALQELRGLTGSAEEVRHVPRVLAEGGIRFVVVQHLAGTRFDGACFWLDKRSPVIAISGRYDRIDNLWHTLMHEVGHVSAGDGLDAHEYFAVDEDLGRPGDGRPKSEVAADEFASSFLVDQDQLEDFILRVGPLYSRQRIEGFAHRQGVHPGIVVGQLHWRNEIEYSHNRRMLVKVRALIGDSSLIDGWGFTPPVAPID